MGFEVSRPASRLGTIQGRGSQRGRGRLKPVSSRASAGLSGSPAGCPRSQGRVLTEDRSSEGRRRRSWRTFGVTLGPQRHGSTMQHRPSTEIQWTPAPNEHFTGRVLMGPLSQDPDALNAFGVHFEPGARQRLAQPPGRPGALCRVRSGPGTDRGRGDRGGGCGGRRPRPRR